VRRVHKRSGGVPRLINVIAERALLGGYAHDLLSIDARTVDRAADEALAPTRATGGGMGRRSPPIRRMIAGAIGIAAVALAFFLMRRDADPVADAATTAPQLRAIAPTQVANGALDGAALLQRLRATPVHDRRAWDALAASWDAPAAVRAASPDACQPQPAPGWRCLRSRAQIEQLLRYDRPVLLRLRAEPHTAWARLLGADAARVRLTLGEATLEVDRIGLAGLWNGEFLALWRAPDTLEARYAAGDDVAAEWLRARLRGEGVDATDLSTALRTFQARNGLRNDGALDPQTLFALTRTDPGPRLRSQEP
jgi:general secretion pathway protein A